MTQLTLGEVRKVAGQARALSAESDEYLRMAHGAIAYRAFERRRFTAEHIREDIGDPVSPGTMGALFSIHRGHKCIRALGYTEASRKEAHGRVLREWVGTGKRCQNPAESLQNGPYGSKGMA